MVYERIRNQARAIDPLDLIAGHLLIGTEETAQKFAAAPTIPNAWLPPDGARTFADYSIHSARVECCRRPHVILREDPMFGRRGYAKEVIPDEKHGFLVLVVAFTARRDPVLGWKEPMKPRSEYRQYWPPGKVEFVNA